MTLWSLPLAHFRPPDQVDHGIGMAFYRTTAVYDTCVETNKWYCELLNNRHHSSPPSLYTTQAMPMRTRSASPSKKRVPVDSTPKKRANSKEGSAVSKRSQSADTRFSSQQPSKDAAHFKEGRKRTERTTKRMSLQTGVFTRLHR